MNFKLINPEALGTPRGCSNSVLTERSDSAICCPTNRLERQQTIVSDDFVAQFDQALGKVAVVTEAGGSADQIARQCSRTNKTEYLNKLDEVGKAYRRHLGKHFPAMALVEVKVARR